MFEFLSRFSILDVIFIVFCFGVYKLLYADLSKIIDKILAATYINRFLIEEKERRENDTGK